MKNPLAVISGTCAAGALAMLLSAHASAGVVFRSALDPAFGLGFNGLNYSGEAFFNVDPLCLADADRAPIEACGSINLISASITLTFTDPLNNTFTQLLTFYPDASVPADPITQYYVRNNTLAAVDTVPFGPQFANLSPDTYSGPLWLEFFTTFSGDGTLRDVVPHADMITGSCSFEGPFFCTMDPNAKTDVATVTITQVPEPATVALLLTAIAGCWVARRRPNRC